MPIVNYIEKMMGMQDVEVKKIEEEEKRITIYIEMYRKDCECPVCGRKTRRVHDYRWQRVKELPAFGNDVELHIHKRRYACDCGKHFYEPCQFLGKYQRNNDRKTVRRKIVHQGGRGVQGIRAHGNAHIRKHIIPKADNPSRGGWYRRIQGEHRRRKVQLHTYGCGQKAGP